MAEARVVVDTPDTRPDGQEGATASQSPSAQARLCGVDLPPADETDYCGCQLAVGHEGPHAYKRLRWPQRVNDAGQVWLVPRV